MEQEGWQQVSHNRGQPQEQISGATGLAKNKEIDLKPILEEAHRLYTEEKPLLTMRLMEGHGAVPNPADIQCTHIVGNEETMGTLTGHDPIGFLNSLPLPPPRKPSDGPKKREVQGIPTDKEKKQKEPHDGSTHPVEFKECPICGESVQLYTHHSTKYKLFWHHVQTHAARFDELSKEDRLAAMERLDKLGYMKCPHCPKFIPKRSQEAHERSNKCQKFKELKDEADSDPAWCLPRPESLPSFHDIAKMKVNTVKSIPEAARLRVAKASIRCMKAIMKAERSQCDVESAWKLYHMFPKAVLAAYTRNKEPANAEVINDRAKRWLEGRYTDLWEEVLAQAHSGETKVQTVLKKDCAPTKVMLATAREWIENGCYTKARKALRSLDIDHAD